MKTRILLLIPLLTATLAYGEQVCSDRARSTASGQQFGIDPGSPDIVEHIRSGLIWARCPVGFALNDQSTAIVVDDTCDLQPDAEDADGRYTWDEAYAAVDEANPGLDVDGWRLPNVKELSWMVEYRCVQPAQNAAIFPPTNYDIFWSSTSSTTYIFEVATFDFSFGGIHAGRKDQERHNVRLVMNGFQVPNDVF